MKLPRGVSGDELVRALARVGYEVTRQTGSHIRLTTSIQGRHHVTVPGHRDLRTGTLAGILAAVAEHLRIDREELLRRLFG